MRLFRVFLVGILCALFGAPAFAAVGEVDGREPVQWQDYPQIVHLFVVQDAEGNDGWCTGQYIAKDLIVTAGHCVKGWVNQDGKFVKNRKYGGVQQKLFLGPITGTNYKDERFDLELLADPRWYDMSDPNRANSDYAILRVKDPKGYMTEKWYTLVDSLDKTKTIVVSNVGFGWMTILTEDEITRLKKIYDAYMQEPGSHSAEELHNRYESIADGYTQYNGIGRSLSDDKLKIHKGCSMKYDNGNYIWAETEERYQADVWISNCDTFEGNSGGAYIDSNGNLFGVHSGAGVDENPFTGDNETKLASADTISATLKQILNVPSTTTSVVDHSSENQGMLNSALATINSYGFNGNEGASYLTNPNVTGEQAVMTSNATQLAKMQGLDASSIVGGVVSSNTANVEADLRAEADRVWADADTKLAAARKKQNMTRKEFVHMAVAPIAEADGKIKQLEKAYKKAKEREQSLANRTLTALTMAATGIGGMELARGLAEQKADKAAEADMTAYMSTFQCKVGDKRYSGNDTQIEIAGGNELIKLYQEYVDLANSLKERKAALGKKAGIESEVILDKANMGLYDETGKGIENGTYASLYRAARGNENDAAKIQEQKDASKKRVIAGTVVAGAGVVGGTIGNILINGKKDSTDDDDDIVTESYTAQTKAVSADEEDEEEIETEFVEEMAKIDTKTPGCSINSSVSTIPDACKSHYASDANEQARCNKCVNNAGTYEGGRCYVEVVGWACLGKGWPQDNKPNSPAPCATAANRYQDCHIVRKYVDAEKPFTCDPMTSIAPGKTALVSGCGQHGWSAGDKHPPFNLDGPNAVGQNCKLPLSSNMAWRKMYSKGSAIGVTFGGKTVTTGRWCMPSANSSPWNSSNHSGAAKHLLSSSLMGSGESRDKWFSLD